MIDFDRQFELVKDRIVNSIKELFPREGKVNTLRLRKIWVDDSLSPNDYASQKASRLHGRTWSVPVYADLELVNNATGKVIDREPKFKVASVPKMTARGSFVVTGNEYQVQNMLRLKPGVYTVIQENGELDSWVNTARGANFKVKLDPKTGIFRILAGTTNIRLYPILIGLGVNRGDIEAIWGKDLTDKNSQSGNYDDEIAKAHKAFLGQPATSTAEAVANLSSYFANNTAVSKDVTEKTLGTGFDKVTPELLLETSRKILRVSRGQAKTDDRDAMEFKTVHSVEDLMSERIDKNAYPIARSINRNLDRKTHIKHMISSNTFGSPIDTFFTGSDEFSGLAQVTPQTNPLSMVGETNKTTTLGPGGIGSVHSITMEARAVHPSSFGFLDPVHTPENERIGTTLHIAGARKEGQDLYITVVDPKTGKTKQLNQNEASLATIAFRDQYEIKAGKWKPKGRKIKAVSNGSIVEVAPSKIQYVYPSPKMFFDVSTNSIPFLPSDQGNRAMMASKMLEQALPLSNREIPNVQVNAARGITFEQLVGQGFSKQAPVTGTVTKVTPEEIRIKGTDGKMYSEKLYDRFPLNTHVYMQSEPHVEKGQKVFKGQLLADTNYTKDGVLALGTNLRAAYVPYKGYNFEDGIVISETASKKLTSMHMHTESVNIDQNSLLNLKKYRAYYPNVLDVEAAKKLDEDGVIRVGQTVSFGDVVIAALRKEEAGPESEMLRKLHRAFVQPYRDMAVTWKDEDVGTVVDVVKSPKKVTVYITTEEVAKIGDKLSNRHAAKGTITRIIPDEQMPKDQDGNSVEIILNPHGIPSRINIGQVLETAAGKVAAKQGKPYVVDNFSGQNYVKEIKSVLANAGIKDKENLFDPSLNKEIPGVLVGNQYVMKLDHPTRKKYSARSRGGYTAELQPHRGHGSGGQAIGKMEYAALLASGAKHNLREMATIKSEHNDEFWRFLQTGQPLPAPNVPFAFQKLEAMIKGMGVDVAKEGSKLQLAPLTDDQIKEMSNGEVKDALAIRAKDLRPEKGGIFDPVSTGGLKGKHWNHVKLAEPVPNPVFETAIRELLGITEREYRELVEGRRWINKSGADVSPNDRGAITGGKAIKVLLDQIDVDREIQTLKARAPGLKGSDLAKVNRKLRYLQALKKKGLSPSIYVINNFPMVPAIFRPIYPLPDGSLGISQVNELYRDAILVNNQLKQSEMPDSMKVPLRKDLYDGLKGIVGLGSSVSGRKRKGFIEQIAGSAGAGPKTGYFQSKIMSRRQELTGRSTIVPEPTLALDEVALPEDMAWTIYQPFIITELVKNGYTPLQAKDEVEKKSEVARRALEIGMKDRPVLLNRAPTLHKFSIMAFKPEITQGKAIKINPLITSGFNADFDGDTMAVHVPVTEDARKEAFKMLPSANLFSPRDGSLMNLPSQEAVLGLYLMTTGGRNTQGKFDTVAEAMKAYQTGKYKLADTATIAGKRMTIGAAVINSVLPDEYRQKGLVATKKNLAKLLNEMAKTKPQVFADVVSKLKDLGNQYSYESGFSVGLDDLSIGTKQRDKIFADADKKAKKVGPEAAYAEAAKKLDSWLEKHLGEKQNPFFQMSTSGAKGNMSQIRQVVGAPVLVKDVNDQIFPVPIKHSYSEGLPVADYLAAMPGARKGIVDRTLMTSKPGAFNKELVQASLNERISMKDCGTSRGLSMSVDDPEALDRYLAKGISGVATKNTLVTPDLLSRLRGKVKEILVRSPSTCQSPQGICQMCYGLDEHGKPPELNANVGALAAQTISEPMSQMTMRTFHTGSVAEARKGMIGGFERVKELLEMHETVRGKAALAEVSGKVDSVKKTPVGGWNVTIGGREHIVDPGRDLKIKKGQTVESGDALSSGAIKPQELLRYKGLDATRDYLVNAMNREFKDQGIEIKRKVYETAVRPLINTGQVLEPGSSLHMPGDMATISSIEMFNKGKPEADRIKFEPLLKGVNTYPLTSEDWLSRLNYQQLSKTLTQGASQGWKSDIEKSPVGSYAYGIFFGKEPPEQQKMACTLELEDLEIPELLEAS